MRLSALDVRDLRILEALAIEPGTHLNVFVGPNAAGKTSILEAIHVLATGRSFAATRTGRLVRVGYGPMRVVGRVQAASGGSVHRLGLERGGTGQARMRVDGQPAERLADLARLLPVVAVHPESHQLVAGGPGERRSLIDQGLFHVEPRFHGVWQRYRRALSQRNVLLRCRAREGELRPWEAELAQSGEAIDAMRRAYVVALEAGVKALAGSLLGDAGEVELVYRPGWNEGEALGDALARLRGRDLEQRVTAVGPHRADLIFRMGGRDVRQRVSRGQQKLLVYVIRLAQARQLAETGDGSCVLLLDDLPAELDAERRRRVLAMATSIGAQCFVTALERESLAGSGDASPCLFHVEQGRVREVLQ